MSELETLRGLIDERTRRFEEALRFRDELLNERYETQTKALDAAFIAADKAVAAALASAEKATDKAEASSKERADMHNGLLQKMEQQGATFVTRETFETKTGELERRISELSRSSERASGKDTGTTAARTTIYATIGIVVTIVLAVLTILTLNN